MTHILISHKAYVAESFAAICDSFELRGHELVQRATTAAATFAADLASYLEEELPAFDATEPVAVALGAVHRNDASMTIPVEWHADRTKRLLPNVNATISVVPLVPVERGRVSELSLQGSSTAPRLFASATLERLLARKLMDATLHTFMRHLSQTLEDDPNDDLLATS